MIYLVAGDLPTTPAGERFRALLARPQILQMLGAHNDRAALQARAAGFEAMGYRMVIWPVSSLRVSARAQQRLYAAIRRDGGTHNHLDHMQTRAELYATIDYAAYEALDQSIVATVVPHGVPQRDDTAPPHATP